MMHKRVSCHDEAANHQLPIAAAFRIMSIVSAEECSSLAQNVMQTHCSTQSSCMRQPHSTRAHSTASTAPTDWYSEVVIVHTCALQSALLD